MSSQIKSKPKVWAENKKQKQKGKACQLIEIALVEN